MALKTYSEVLAHLKKSRREKHLLLGNGFSIAYDKDIFSYDSLSKFVYETKNPLLMKLFRIINTSNFELVMRQLDTFHKLASQFLEDKILSKKIVEARDSLKTNLLAAISDLHPEQVFKIPEEKSRKCAAFLKEYLDNDGHVFSMSYDLLLYWVLMSNQDEIDNIVDGFGRDRISDDDEEPEFGDLEWGRNREEQRVHYLHGALHIFDAGISIEKEVYNGDYILVNIKRRIEEQEYPVFVTAGHGREKLEHISHNKYLVHSYDQLCEISGSLVTLGFNFGDYDCHIIDAINKAARQDIDEKLWSIYIGVYSEDDKAHIERIGRKFKCKVNMYDARTANVWG